MRVEWHGQAAFTLTGQEAKVFIDPFGEMAPLLAGRGLKFDYPPIEAGGVDLLLVTHEHRDHNAVEVIGGDPEVLRSTAGKLESPIGEVLAVASEHDERAGTERGPNTIFVFELDGLRVAHFGDFGQRELREEQAAAIVSRLPTRWVVPMHYRTPRADFLPESEEEFATAMPQAARLEVPRLDTAELPSAGGPIAVVPAVP